MAIEYFTDSDGNERIRKTTVETVTFNGKDWNVYFNVPKDNYTVGDSTDTVGAEADLDDGLRNIVSAVLTNSYYLTEEQMLLIHPEIQEITE